MQYRRTAFKSLFLIVLLVSVFGLGIAYALLSTTLTISGTTSVSAATWDIHFNNLNASKTGDATYTLPQFTSATALTDYEIVLTKPGDSVTFTFDIVNAGTIRSSISSLVKGTPSCSGVAGSSTGTTDGPIVCNNLSYTFTYSDGTVVSVGDTLNKGETKSVKLTLSYNGSATQVPVNDVAISNLDITMIYSQA